ncbi:MAG TPA: pitrilysin family protein [Bryobacteraceae bacterium]|nr:pitrilysin family protein [Bryobacteraceae bacterium]
MKKVLLALSLSALTWAQPAAAPAKVMTIPSYKSLKFGPAPEIKIPDIPMFTLANGMKVYLLENHELPLVSGFALVRTGNLFDPKDKIGLAELTGTVMRSGGTKSKTGEQLDEQLENVAASVETSIGESNGRIGFSALKENVDDVLAIFQDVMQNAEFRQDKLDLAKQQLRSSISRRNDDPGDILNRNFAEIVYGRDNPYGWRMEYEHIDNIKRDDLIAFYKRYFFPANMILAVQGDFATADMRAKIEKLFGSWSAKQEPVPAFPPVTAKPSPGVYLATKNDVTQTNFSFGHLGGELKDPNYPALSVMADILGGGFSSRLFKNVRTKLGLAYSVSGGWGATYDHPGLFQVSGSTKSQSTVDTIQAAQSEVNRIRTTEVTDQELDTAKQSVLNSFVFFFDSPSKTLSRLMTYEYYGYPKDFIFQYQKGVQATTKADVLRVAKQYLKPEDIAIVAVGKPADFVKPLTTLGPVKEIDLSISEPKKAPAASSDSASLARGRSLIQKAQQAVGGADKLAAVKDFTQSVEAALTTPQGSLKAQQTNQWMRSGAFRQTQQLPFGKIQAYYDGKTNWLASPQGVMEMPPPVLRQMQGEKMRVFFELMLADRNPEWTVNAVAENAVEISSKQGDRVRIDFDSSGLPAKYSYQSMGMQGPTAVVSTPSDYREVSGIRLPHKVVIEQGGQKFAEATVSEWKLNSGLTAEELSKKP